MNPAIVVAVISGAFGLIGIILSLVRGTRVDNAVNATKTIELSVSAQQGLIDNLSKQLERQEKATANCQSRCDELAEENIQLQDKHEAMRVALNATKSVVGEHEATIARQEREIARLRNEINTLRDMT